MALTQALSAFNTLLFMGDGAATEAFIVVSELKTVQGPSFAADTIDVTRTTLLLRGTATLWDCLTVVRCLSISTSSRRR